ncbi:hypothetical protein HCN44_010883 [Aphidius gifuensis]|uniref:Uncharacterized protein n=1 Tax=Aphidius gifuensis TaxID=684658 RepID=A0A835CNE7_APHGI|nr:hypothetical protein HCN44_010883 [Aphidius gifuensis]
MSDKIHKNNSKQSIENLDMAIKLILNNIDSYSYDACCGCINGLLLFTKVKLYYCDYDGAVNILKKLLDNVDSTNATAHLLMAQIFINQGNYQSASQTDALMNEAKQIFSSTIEESRIKISRAELSLDMDKIDRSIKYLSDIKPNEPYYLEGHKKLTEIHLNIIKC